MEETYHRCGYRNCDVMVPNAALFRMCDRCRILDNRERTALATDPTLPHWPNELAKSCGVILTQFTAEEFLNYVQKIEELYLECQKLKFKYMPSRTDRRVELTPAEAADEVRASIERVSGAKKRGIEKVKTDRALQAKRESKAEKALYRTMDMLGCSESCRFMTVAGKQIRNNACEHWENADKLMNEVPEF